MCRGLMENRTHRRYFYLVYDINETTENSVIKFERLQLQRLALACIHFKEIILVLLLLWVWNIQRRCGCFFSPSRVEVGFPRIERSPLNSGHSRVMCLMDSWVRQYSHVGFGFFGQWILTGQRGVAGSCCDNFFAAETWTGRIPIAWRVF